MASHESDDEAAAMVLQPWYLNRNLPKGSQSAPADELVYRHAGLLIRNTYE